MLALFAALVATAPHLTPPQPWALNFSPEGCVPMTGDIDADGFADLISFNPKGDGYIDVAITRDGQKPLAPARAISNFGKDASAVASGELDAVAGVDILCLTEGNRLQMAADFHDGTFVEQKDWLTLPSKLESAHLAVLGKTLFAWDQRKATAFAIDVRSRTVSTIVWPKNVLDVKEVVARNGSAAVFTFQNGEVKLADEPLKAPDTLLGRCIPGSSATVANAWIFVDRPEDGAPTFVVARPLNSFPPAASNWGVGDIDHDGDKDLIQFRFGSEAHSGNNVLLYRFVSNGETDDDHDGLSNSREAELGTDPQNPDTDNDGLLDGWEVGEYRGLDLKGLGCDPKRIDLICLMSRFSTAKEEMVERQIKNAAGYYESLGWALHPIWLDEMNEQEQTKPWWENRDRNIPLKWRGVVHWMQLSPNGGGQADQLGDGGGCGGNEWALYATFIHEFGHQLGLSHEGFYNAAWCPTYPSLMNYAYSYGYENDIKKVRYSNGSLKDFVMRETDLDETLPLPYEKVKFLEQNPYHYRLKANGETTLIDWNWNGVFGEKHVRADVNYSYSTTAGRRDEVDRTWSAPYLFTHQKSAFVLYAQHDQKPDKNTDPSVSLEKPGWLMLRRLIKPYQWEKPIKLDDKRAIGDPVAISYKGEIVVAYPSKDGLTVRWLRMKGGTIERERTTVVSTENALPSLGIADGKLILFDWSPTTGWVHYRVLGRNHQFSAPSLLLSDGAYPKSVKSTVPISMAYDDAARRVIIGLAQDQDEARPSRWQIRRYKFVKNGFVAASAPEWVEAEKGQARGRSRPTVLIDENGLTGWKGRILYFGQGMVSAAAPWACEYVAETVGDKTVGGGWMVKRYYDEWTQSRSAPSACWFGGDIIYAYRWIDGSQNDRDNLLHIAYNGSGVENAPMGDFDDIGYMRDFGIRNSILYLRQ